MTDFEAPFDLTDEFVKSEDALLAAAQERARLAGAHYIAELLRESRGLVAQYPAEHFDFVAGLEATVIRMRELFNSRKKGE